MAKVPVDFDVGLYSDAGVDGRFKLDVRVKMNIKANLEWSQQTNKT